jgi:integrase
MVKMGWQHIEGDCIAVRQEKTGEPLLFPIDAPLAAVRAVTACANLPLLLNEHGQPFTSKAFGNWFRIRCNEAGLPQCSAHGLRKLAATRLAKAGCSNQEIKAITGHRSDASLAPYIRKANKVQLARQARERLRVEQERNLPKDENPGLPKVKKT